MLKWGLSRVLPRCHRPPPFRIRRCGLSITHILPRHVVDTLALSPSHLYPPVPSLCYILVLALPRVIAYLPTDHTFSWPNRVVCRIIQQPMSEDTLSTRGRKPNLFGRSGMVRGFIA
jgi:hypothetical protein